MFDMSGESKGAKRPLGRPLDGGVGPFDQSDCELSGRVFRDLLNASVAGWDVQLLGDEKAPNGELVDFQPPDSGATDCQSTDGKCADGYCADGHCAQRQPAYRKRAGCKRTQRSWGGARRSQFASGRETRCQALQGEAWTASVVRGHETVLQFAVFEGDQRLT